ncbi:transposase [Lactococcus formosensis]|jgi:transposase|uniref:Transposase n=1 Tax=Lactococcus formosensis TaxID=1281486 RepID=A0A9Q8Y521_9LACT|nr:transposase [Lactococcus formosensis]USJ21605.1 transposase [Lactococcus formosensis]
MTRKRKYYPEQIIQICQEYISGQKTASQLCLEHGLSKGKPPGLFWRGVANYRENGTLAFNIQSGNQAYTSVFKKIVVEEYLDGCGSLLDMCVKYHISSESLLQQWITLYNANRELRDYNPKREVRLGKQRSESIKYLPFEV